ncbi:MAG: transglycosylase SLT domain-containing protein [Acidobacteria bacterium]|nr:transglycosylase SLT domain-containing protein [Acidobacteriota bacterium]
MKRSVLAFIGLLMLVPAAPAPRAQQARYSPTSGDVTVLSPTAHPQVPRDLAQLWLAPDRTAPRSNAVTSVMNAARFTASGEYSKALAVATQPIAKEGPLGQYAAYYAGVAQLRLNRAADALKSFRSVQDQKPTGYLWEAAAIGEAEASEALDRPADAVRIYNRLLKGRLSNVEDVYMRLGRAAKAAGDPTRAAEAFAHVFYEFPLGENAATAGNELDALTGLQPLKAGSQRYKVELGRAERLFGARQYADARNAFDALRPYAGDDDRELLRLRVAECDYFTKRARQARDVFRDLSADAARRGEATYFYGLASKEAGEVDTFVSTMQRVAADFPEQTWADDALNALATHYLKTDQDDLADATFRELYRRYPRGNNAERAAWKIGWSSYRQGNYADTAAVFERAASDFSRSDYRPGWLYWSGRAQERLGAAAVAQERYALAAADYANTYYGRLALKRLTTPVPTRALLTSTAAPDDRGLPANGAVVRALLSAEMFDDALNELRYAQIVWGDSPVVQATVAWTRQQQARSESGMKRLLLLRGAINTMKRAYPQFMAAGGEELPREVLTVIYPLAYWDLIRKHAEANRLDPYLVAALVAQESTFSADVKSGANAYGLMQLLPSTARQYAKKLGLRYSSRLLTDPESNIRMGTAYLADKIREFGDLHLVLASYNAGERPVRRWQNERAGLDTDEFIDDIPYPETQNYVKKILGTADDYRRIYKEAQVLEPLESTRALTVPTLTVPSRKAVPAKRAPKAPRKPARRR